MDLKATCFTITNKTLHGMISSCTLQVGEWEWWLWTALGSFLLPLWKPAKWAREAKRPVDSPHHSHTAHWSLGKTIPFESSRRYTAFIGGRKQVFNGRVRFGKRSLRLSIPVAGLRIPSSLASYTIWSSSSLFASHFLPWKWTASPVYSLFILLFLFSCLTEPGLPVTSI